MVEPVVATRRPPLVWALPRPHILIDAAIADDDVDEAIRLSERAIEADPPR